MSGDFRLRDAAAYEKYYGAQAPAPGAARHVRLRPARAEPRRDPDARARRVAGLLRDDDRARRCCRWRAPGLLDGRRRARRRHHRLVGLRRRAAARARTTRCARSTSRPTSRSSTSTCRRSCRRSRRRARRTSSCASCPVSAPLSRGIFATCFVELPARDTTEAIAARCSTRPTRASRSCARPTSACPRSPRSRARTTPRSASRSARRSPARRRGTLAVFCAIDNLIKGGAGQAIQNMNLMLGFDETTSLEDSGPWP